MRNTASLFIPLFVLCPLVAAEAPTNNPVGLRLSGHTEIHGESRQFEIVMEGFDLYYRKEWKGDQEKREGSGDWAVSLIVGDFDGKIGRRWHELGGGGGSSYGKNGKLRPEVGRRLWNGDTLVGVSAADLRVEDKHRHFSEEFCQAIATDRLSTPFVILWTENAGHDRTTKYTVEKAEFIYKQNPDFFNAAKAKHFPSADQTIKNLD